MKMEDFKALSVEERLAKLNAHLLSLKDIPGRLDDKFKSGEFNFSYSLLKKNSESLGIAVDGKSYQAFPMGATIEASATSVERPASPKKAVTKSTPSSKQQQSFTADEIAFLKKLYADTVNAHFNGDPHFMLNDKPMLVVPTIFGAKKTTGISVYISQWERWNRFKEYYSHYSGTDLLAMAIEEFMEKYGPDES